MADIYLPKKPLAVAEILAIGQKRKRTIYFRIGENFFEQTFFDEDLKIFPVKNNPIKTVKKLKESKK